MLHHISQPTWEKLSFPVNLSQCFHNSWEAALKPSKSFSHNAGFRRLARAGQTLRDRANLSRTYQSPQLSSCYGILLCLGMVNVMQTWLTELHCYRKHEKKVFPRLLRSWRCCGPPVYLDPGSLLPWHFIRSCLWGTKANSSLRLWLESFLFTRTSVIFKFIFLLAELNLTHANLKVTLKVQNLFVFFFFLNSRTRTQTSKTASYLFYKQVFVNFKQMRGFVGGFLTRFVNAYV